MNSKHLLWAGLAVLAWAAWRDSERAKAAEPTVPGALTVNADTQIVEEDDTGEALERLIKQLDENIMNGTNRYLNFSVDTPTLQLNYSARPYIQTMVNNRGRTVPYIP